MRELEPLTCGDEAAVRELEPLTCGDEVAVRELEPLTCGDEAAVRELERGAEAAEFDWRRVVAAGKQHAVWLEVAVDDVVTVAVAQRLQDLLHVVAEKHRCTLCCNTGAQCD